MAWLSRVSVSGLVFRDGVMGLGLPFTGGSRSLDGIDTLASENPSIIRQRQRIRGI